MSLNQFPNVTPSRAAALVCRKRYYEEHVLKSIPREEFSQNLTFGTGIHMALKRLTDPTIPVPFGERNIEDGVRRAFNSQKYPDIDTREADICRAIPIVASYLAQDEDAASIVGTEVFADFTLTTSGFRKIMFGAKFDALIARRQNGVTLVIRDYKSGRFRDVDMESACIAIAVAKAKLNQFKQDYGLPFSGVVLELDYLGENGLSDRVTLGINEVKSVWPELKARVQYVYNSVEFPPEPGEHCLFCPLRKACRPNQSVNMTELDAIFS
jgi:hypothetical protein